MKRLWPIILALLPAAASADDELDTRFGKDALIVVASQYACHRFDVYLAMTAEQRARGLMFVEEMPPTTGMLFVYERDGYISMYMKNTYIPLDMVFARADGTVSSVVQNTEPLSLRTISANEPVRFVLELNAGTARRLHIDDASYLEWQPRDGER